MQQNDRALARWLGPTVVVLAAIAGDEVEGVAAAHRLFQHLVLSRCAVQTSNSGIRYCGHPFRGVLWSKPPNSGRQLLLLLPEGKKDGVMIIFI